MDKLIKCGDHQYAPYSVVCIHLMYGESKEWIPIDNRTSSEVDYDWLCPKCETKLIEGKINANESIDCLKLVCIHCISKLRDQYDINFIKEE